MTHEEAFAFINKCKEGGEKTWKEQRITEWIKITQVGKEVDVRGYLREIGCVYISLKRMSCYFSIFLNMLYKIFYANILYKYFLHICKAEKKREKENVFL